MDKHFDRPELSKLKKDEINSYKYLKQLDRSHQYLQHKFLMEEEKERKRLQTMMNPLVILSNFKREMKNVSQIIPSKGKYEFYQTLFKKPEEL